MEKVKTIAILLLVFGFGVFLRVYHLGSESLLFDEAMSIYFAKGNLYSLINLQKWELHSLDDKNFVVEKVDISYYLYSNVLFPETATGLQ